MACITVSTPMSFMPSGAFMRRRFSRGSITVVKPRRWHSAMRRSHWGMARTSPARPTSPMTATSAPMLSSFREEATAMHSARSAAGSDNSSPPATLMYTSWL